MMRVDNRERLPQSCRLVGRTGEVADCSAIKALERQRVRGSRWCRSTGILRFMISYRGV